MKKWMGTAAFLAALAGGYFWWNTEPVAVQEPPYIRKLTGVWNPWPCAWCDTCAKCDEVWKKMQDQTTPMARGSRTPIIGTDEFQDGWSGESIQEFYRKQKLGYDDCRGLLGCDP